MSARSALLRRFFVRGAGLYTTGFAGVEDWMRGEPDPALKGPTAGLLEGNLRRRASLLTRMSVDVLAQAALQAGCDAVRTPSVWATVHGEHATAIRLLQMMHRGDGKLSPTHFHNSVHNTASGYASIATGNVAPSTTLTGGGEIVMAALLEAFCRIDASGDDVLLVMADEPLQAAFECGEMIEPLAIALCISARDDGPMATLSGLRREAVSPVSAREPFGPMHVSVGLTLLEHVVQGASGTIALEHAASGRDGLVWCIDVGALDDSE